MRIIPPALNRHDLPPPRHRASWYRITRDLQRSAVAPEGSVEPWHAAAGHDHRGSCVPEGAGTGVPVEAAAGRRDLRLRLRHRAGGEAGSDLRGRRAAADAVGAGRRGGDPRWAAAGGDDAAGVDGGGGMAGSARTNAKRSTLSPADLSACAAIWRQVTRGRRVRSYCELELFILNSALRNSIANGSKAKRRHCFRRGRGDNPGLARQ